MKFPGISLAGGLPNRLKEWVMGTREKDTASMVLYDRTLLWLTFGLAIIGFVMVTSASMPVGQRLNDDAFYFAKRDAFYLILALGMALVTLRVPMDFWQRYSNMMLLVTVLMLLVVLVVGSSVNGASRWIALGPLRIQPAFAISPAIWCARLRKYVITSGVSANRWA